MICIVDYGVGNLRSVQNMLRVLGHDSKIVSTPDEVSEATKIILPGVGHFDFGMKSLAERNLINVLNEKVLEHRTPVLGICLGAQLLTRRSDEGEVSGLGWINAETTKFDSSRLDSSLRIPHMGWADTEYRRSNRLFEGAGNNPRYYFVHSFHIVCEDEADELCHATHGYRFVAGVARENIRGVQFHPEKSHRFGKRILANFAESRQ